MFCTYKSDENVLIKYQSVILPSVRGYFVVVVAHGVAAHLVLGHVSVRFGLVQHLERVAEVPEDGGDQAATLHRNTTHYYYYY